LAADSVFDRIKRDGPTQEEVDRVKAGLDFSSVARLENTLNKAETLANGSVFFDDPDAFRKQIAATAAVTPADVKRVANTYLTNGRVVLSVVPMGKLDQASKPEASVKVGAASSSSTRREVQR
jgi:predicted Zn-dependent peptidase